MSFSITVNHSKIAEPKIQPNRSSYSYTPPEEVIDFGKVYILEIHMENSDGSITKYIKCGVTKRNIQDRVGEILASIWFKCRYYPKTVVKRYTAMSEPYVFERELHTKLSDYQARLPFKHDGHTEIFNCTLEHATEIYDEMLKGRKNNF